MKVINKDYEFSRFDLSTIILLVCLFVFVSCEENQTTKRLIIISGKLIDSPQNVNFSDYTLTARSIFGTKEETLASTTLNEDGTFRMEYYSEGSYVGNNLRISVYPLIGAQQKLEFLTYGESWNKNFYIGDSSKVVIKLIGDYTKIDTLRLVTDIGNILFKGPLSSNTLGTFRFGNYNQYVYYRYNPKNKFVYYEATGDPIVDTITLEINP
jgi:hypothetical protein